MAEIVSCVSMYDDTAATARALNCLCDTGFESSRVSVLVHVEPQETEFSGFVMQSGQVDFLGEQAGFWRAVSKALTGLGCFCFPELGTVVAAGPVVSLLTRKIEGVDLVRGQDLLADAFYRLGVPRRTTGDYRDAIASGKLLLIVSGGRQSVEQACGVLHCGEQQITVHTA